MISGLPEEGKEGDSDGKDIWTLKDHLRGEQTDPFEGFLSQTQ